MTRAADLILYVDDEYSNRVVFEHTFNESFSVETVESPHAALEVLARREVAVLVTDQRMPGMSGNDLLTRAKEEYPNTVRIVITAYSDFDPLLRAVNDGLVARYVIKPWDAEELTKMLSWALEAYRLGVHDSALQLRLLETERLVTLGSISAAVFHDLRQPVSFLHMCASTLEQFAPVSKAIERLLKGSHDLARADVMLLREVASELPSLAGDLTKGCDVLVKLLNEASLVRSPSPDGEAEGPIDPLPIVRYAISVCQTTVFLSGGSISYRGPEPLPRLVLPSVALAQILINLISNAAQALDRSGHRGGEVSVDACVDGPDLVFTIADTGPGMPPEVLAKIGTPFFTTRPDGSGLGVAQVRRLCEGAGGSVSIRSTLGEGTTIVVRLPLELVG